MSILHNNTWTFLVSSSFPLLISIIRSTAKIETQLCAARGRWSEQRLRMRIQKRFHLTVRSLGMLPESVQCENQGFASQNRNEALFQPTCWAKDILLHLYRTELHDFFGKQIAWTSVGAHFEPVLKSFPTEKKFTTVNGAVGQGHGWRERLNAKNPRWTAPAEARRSRIQGKFGEYLISPPKRCLIFKEHFSAVQEEMATIWWSKMGGS